MAEFRSIVEPTPHKKANPFHKQNIIQKKKTSLSKHTSFPFGRAKNHN